MGPDFYATSRNLPTSLMIEVWSNHATYRVRSMYTVGSGICHCGDSMEGHYPDETHTPTEMLVDKDYYGDTF